MRHLLSRVQMRAFDEHAMQRCAVPSLVLMENAGRGAAETILAAMAQRKLSGPIVIVCGSGNNGGDGFVVARHLYARGCEVHCWLAAARDRVTGDARANLAAWLALGGSLALIADDLAPLRQALAGAALVVDALFGTGLDRPITGRLAEVVGAINVAPGLRVALDIPSGVDCDTGAALGCAVRADVTVTFAHRKLGLYAGAGVTNVGTLEVVPLGVLDEPILGAVGWRASLLEPSDAARALRRREPDAHKYQAGNVLVVAGSPGKIGAALLAARAALRTGAGLVTIASSPEACASMDGRVPEVMTQRLDSAALDASLTAALERRGAVAIGPGLGLDAHARAICDAIALTWKGPVVLDADALTHFAGRAAELRQAPAPRILTPHAGELGRMLGVGARDVEADRFGSAERAAAETGATVVLKGRYTIVATPGERPRVCDRGSAVLATAGSGDVLTGIAGALACITRPFDAACGAVYLHALAADRWRARTSADRGLLAGDLADELPGAIGQVQAGSAC